MRPGRVARVQGQAADAFLHAQRLRGLGRAVHKHGDPGLSENNVRLAWQIFDVLAEPQSSSVKSGAYPHFKAGILALEAGHTEAALFGCQVVRHQTCP